MENKTIAIVSNSEPTITAKQLHKNLKIETIFKHWWQRRKKKFNLIEGEHFCSIKNATAKKGKGGHNEQDFVLKLTIALTISANENNEQGRKQAKKLSDQLESYHKALVRADKRETKEIIQQLRLKGKEVRRNETDKIKILIGQINEETEGKSKLGDYAYIHYSNLVRDNLFIIEGEKKGYRDRLDMNQHITLQYAENKIIQELQRHMEEQTPYKEIYGNIKDIIKQFAELEGLTVVKSNQLLLFN